MLGGGGRELAEFECISFSLPGMYISADRWGKEKATDSCADNGGLLLGEPENPEASPACEGHPYKVHLEIRWLNCSSSLVFGI